jgi:O-antigen/teichoic acid export membrane protein
MSDSSQTVDVTPRTSLAVGASWLLASKICAFAITSALPFILVRRLSQTEFGYYKQLFLILQTTLNLLPFGMNMSLFFFIPRAKTQAEKGNIVLSVVIFYLFTTGIAGACFMVNPGLIEQLFHSQPLTAVGRQIGLTMIPYIVSSLLDIILVANGETRLAAISNVAITMARTLLILVAALVWGTIGAILWAVLIVAVLQFVWMATYMRIRFGDFWKSFRWMGLRTQLVYALPLGLAGFILVLQMDVDNYFVSHYFNAAMFAIYATGCFDVPLVGMLGDSVGSVLIPRISALQAAGSTGEIVRVTVSAIRGLAFAYAPIFVFVSVAANQVIAGLFRVEYLASVPIFRINLLWVLLSIVAVDPVLRAFKSEHLWMMRMNIALLALLVVALFFGTTHYGLIGTVSSVIGVQYLARGIFVWKIRRLLKVRREDLRPLTDVLKTLLAAAIAGLCILPLLVPFQRWGALTSVAICGLIYCGVYLAGILILKVPSESEVVWFRSTARLRLRAIGIG